MRGVVAVTDPGWFEHLAGQRAAQDVNFWRPSTKPLRLDPGTPFFFKLKAPHHAIAGFGYFAHFSVLPDWLAWETFGTANGAPSLGALRKRLARIQRGASIRANAEGRIGCALIAQSVLFPQDAWVRAPSDWKRNIVTSKGYDLRHGEGRRIWEACRARAVELSGEAQPVAGVAAEGAPRYGTPSLYAPRLGQGIFRVQVLDAYGRACAVTREHSLPVVEAAHIRPYAQGGRHEVSNGLSLRTDLHRLFDRGYATFDEDLRLVVSAALRDEYENGVTYYRLVGTKIAPPSDPAMGPSEDALAWHREHVFQG